MAEVRGKGRRLEGGGVGGGGGEERSSQGIVTLWKPKLKMKKMEPKPLKSSS